MRRKLYVGHLIAYGKNRVVAERKILSEMYAGLINTLTPKDLKRSLALMQAVVLNMATQ